ncbi:MAG: hypothetical protein HWE16_04965 [Gammaproteobacteria bacterium]|nr:hypothetical protein [Gammaproteobacteria bacterium]
MAPKPAGESKPLVIKQKAIEMMAFFYVNMREDKKWALKKGIDLMFILNKKRNCPSCSSETLLLKDLFKSTKYKPTSCNNCGKRYTFNNNISEVFFSLLSSLLFVFILVVISTKSLFIPIAISILAVLTLYLIKLFEVYKLNLVEIEKINIPRSIFNKLGNAIFWAMVAGFWIAILYFILKFKGVL